MKSVNDKKILVFLIIETTWVSFWIIQVIWKEWSYRHVWMTNIIYKHFCSHRCEDIKHPICILHIAIKKSYVLFHIGKSDFKLGGISNIIQAPILFHSEKLQVVRDHTHKHPCMPSTLYPTLQYSPVHFHSWSMRQIVPVNETRKKKLKLSK